MNVIVINGPMGIGKTTVGTYIADSNPGTAFIDGDWCMDLHPFVGNKETRDMAVNNIRNPNNIGRCGHICNASYAVSSESRGKHIGEKLVLDCLKKGKEIGFRVLQFNAVVESNVHARHLYERLGFTQLGTITGGFRMKDGHYENICPYFKELLDN